MTGVNAILFISGILLLAALLASKISSRFGIPALLLFLVIGMLAGSEGPGGIPFDNAGLAQALGVVALSFILFSGGFGTEWKSVAPVLWQGLTLATVGVFLTGAVLGCAARLFLHTPWLESLLLGSIVSSTDAAAVFSVLRSSGIQLKGRLRPLLEFESGSNDPMAVFLTVALIQAITRPEAGVLTLAGEFLLQMTVGAAAGYLLGKATVFLVNKINLETEGLYPVITVAAVALVYSVTAILHGNGFLAVYLAGIVIGNAELLHKRSLGRFLDAVAWLVQIAMFLTLGLLVFPSRLVPIAGVAFALSAVLMFVARPVGVFLSLAFSRVNLRRKLLISWVGLRGAAPIILATFPLVARLPQADLFFNIVFFIVLTSVLLQATLIPQVARKLRLQAPLQTRRPSPLEFVPARRTSKDMIEVVVPERSPVADHRIVELRLPHSALIVLITRRDEYISPRGDTVLKAGDRLLVVVDKPDEEQLHAVLGMEREEEAAD